MKYQVSHIKKQDKKRFANLVLRSLFGKVPMKGFNIFHARLVKNAQAPMVRHRRTAEFVYCLKGSFQVVLNKKRYSLKQGHIIWIPPGVWHMFKTKTQDAEALAIFSPRMNLGKNPDVELPKASRKTKK